MENGFTEMETTEHRISGFRLIFRGLGIIPLREFRNGI
jgi:hypothetical protein